MKKFSVSLLILTVLLLATLTVPAGAQNGPSLPALYMTVKPDGRIDPGTPIDVLLWTDPVQAQSGKNVSISIHKNAPRGDIAGFPPASWDLFDTPSVMIAGKSVVLGSEGEHSETIVDGLPRGSYTFSAGLETSGSGPARLIVEKQVHVGPPLPIVDLVDLSPMSGDFSLSDSSLYAAGDTLFYTIRGAMTSDTPDNMNGSIRWEVHTAVDELIIEGPNMTISPGDTEVSGTIDTTGWDEDSYVFRAFVQADGDTATQDLGFGLNNVIVTDIGTDFSTPAVRGNMFRATAVTYVVNQIDFTIRDEVAGVDRIDTTTTIPNHEGDVAFDTSDFDVSDQGNIGIGVTASVEVNPVYSDNASEDFPDFLVNLVLSGFGLMEAGDPLDINVSTALQQADASGNLTIGRDGEPPVYETPVNLDSDSQTTINIPGSTTESWENGTYNVEATINGDLSTQTGSSLLFVGDQPSPALQLSVQASKTEYMGYDPLELEIELTPSQTATSLTIYGSDDLFFNTLYLASYSDVGFSSRIVHVPITSPADAEWSWTVLVSTEEGFGFNESSVPYVVGSQDTDGDWLPDPVEQSLSFDGRQPDKENHDTDGDNQYDGIEVYHGFDPTDPGSMIPEFTTWLMLGVIPAVFLLLNLYRKRLE